MSLHHSDHDGVVRIFVGHTEVVKRLLFRLFRLDYLDYITRHNFSPTRSVTRGNRTPGSRVATPVATRHSEAKYCNSFQLTHRPRGNHALSIASNGYQKEDKTLLQHAQVSQHGEFRHVNVSERQRSHLCGQNLCGAFVRAVLATNFEESDRAMAADGTTKALVSPPPR